mmetsp:Transcript_55237/g.144058  ORF Transcript_55237/g.144058 Transcript_55237/m.144058 type:complete len:88 (+) Transcript_55237:20-283(+)
MCRLLPESFQRSHAQDADGFLAILGWHAELAAQCGRNVTECSLSSWPANVRKHSPVFAHQTFAVWSAEAVSTSLPSGENAAECKAPA